MIIIVTGPESTGKTQLTLQLAEHYKGLAVPEYAREYIAGLDHKYTYNDVEHIAQTQLSQMQQAFEQTSEYVFFDTYLLITKVWFKHVFQQTPEWIDKELAKTKDALYLLCRPDIPWEPDPLRENGGEMRMRLFEQYEEELQQMRFNYRYIEGEGEKRLQCATNHINKIIINN